MRLRSLNDGESAVISLNEEGGFEGQKRRTDFEVIDKSLRNSRRLP
jgi:hypothetical protein